VALALDAPQSGEDRALRVEDRQKDGDEGHGSGAKRGRCYLDPC
jgi:hypothetical protein